MRKALLTVFLGTVAMTQAAVARIAPAAPPADKDGHRIEVSAKEPPEAYEMLEMPVPDIGGPPLNELDSLIHNELPLLPAKGTDNELFKAFYDRYKAIDEGKRTAPEDAKGAPGSAGFYRSAENMLKAELFNSHRDFNDRLSALRKGLVDAKQCTIQDFHHYVLEWRKDNPEKGFEDFSKFARELSRLLAPPAPARFEGPARGMG